MTEENYWLWKITRSAVVQATIYNKCISKSRRNRLFLENIYNEYWYPKRLLKALYKSSDKIGVKKVKTVKQDYLNQA